MSDHIRLKPFVCPHCSTDLTSATKMVAERMGGFTPTTGDCSICFTCTEIAVFEVNGEDVDLRKPTDDEMSEFRNDPEVMHIVKALRKMRKAQQH